MSVRPISNAASNLGGTVYSTQSTNSVKFDLMSDKTGTLTNTSDSLKRVRASWTYGSGSYNRPYSQGCRWFIKYTI